MFAKSTLTTFLLFGSSNGFSPNFANLNTLESYTELYAKGKRGSMAQKRKQRGQKVAPKTIFRERPKILDTVPRPDQWEKIESTEEKVQTMKKEEEETKAKAAALIESQRKSVDVLTHVKNQIELLPAADIVDAIQSGSYFVCDNVLGDDLALEMSKEGKYMFENNKLELDLGAGITSGQYAAAITGGQDQYVDCPRTVEYVVSCTRHLSGMLNTGLEDDEEKSLPYKLDETASMAGLRVFDRKARKSSLTLLTGNEDACNDTADLEEKPFGFVTDDSQDEIETRKVSSICFMVPDGWDESCGGGIVFKDKDGNENIVEAKNDRLVVFSSESSSYRLRPFLGRDEIDTTGSYIIKHLVRERQ